MLFVFGWRILAALGLAVTGGKRQKLVSELRGFVDVVR